MQLHQIKSIHKSKDKKRVGRGGKRGTYSGRGLKGQNARAGRKKRPEIRDLIKTIPKKRGYRFKSFRIKPQIVDLSDLEKKFNAGETVSPETLLEKGLIAKIKGRVPEVKILLGRRSSESEGAKKKLKIENCIISKSAEKSLK